MDQKPGNNTEQDLQVFVTQILHIRWPEKISNSELWNRTRHSSIKIPSNKENGIGYDIF
jgi:hypothetical protein